MRLGGGQARSESGFTGVSFYSDAPNEELTLEDFELHAFERLKGACAPFDARAASAGAAIDLRVRLPVSFLLLNSSPSLARARARVLSRLPLLFQSSEVLRRPSRAACRPLRSTRRHSSL